MPLDLPPGLWVPQKPAIIRASRLPETPADARGIRMMPPLALGLGGSFASLLGSTALTSSFPVVAAVNSNAQGTGSNNKVVNLPAGIASGDLLLALCAQPETAFGTAPTGWNQLHSVSGSSQISLQLCYRVADGSEGASVTFAGHSIRRSAHLSMRITGFQGAPESQITASTTSAAPDSPSLAPSWGAANTLWISMFAVAISATNPVTGYPANYTNGFSIENSPAGNPSALVAASWRELNAVSENPGAAAITNSAPWRAITIGIRPA